MNTGASQRKSLSNRVDSFMATIYSHFQIHELFHFCVGHQSQLYIFTQNFLVTIKDENSQFSQVAQMGHLHFTTFRSCR